jgi:hypothetical protein
MFKKKTEEEIFLGFNIYQSFISIPSKESKKTFSCCTDTKIVINNITELFRELRQ